MVQAASSASQQRSALTQHQAASTASNVNVQPRFFFGLKGDVKNNVVYLDDNVVAYPCGHNVIVYYISEKMQRFIPGIEGSQGISALAVSQDRQQLAVCEKAASAICTVYSIGKLLELPPEKRSVTIFDVPIKRRRVLCSTEDPAKEFISADFCPKNTRLLVTASAKGDFKIVIWNWDKQRMLHYFDLSIPRHCTVDQVSFSNIDPTVVVVTGDDLYRYLKSEGTSPVLKLINQTINKRESEAHYSTNYTCHAWLNDGRFVICNDHGQIMLLDAQGEYKGATVSDPRKDPFPIMAITTFTGLGSMGGVDAAGATGGAAAAGRGAAASGGGQNNNGAKSGFMVAGESGRFRVFVKSDVDPKKPYLRVDSTDDLFPAQEHYMREEEKPELRLIYQDIDIQAVKSISLSPSEDAIIFTTANNQIMKVPQFNTERPNDDQKYEHLISSFHSKQIHGLDVCTKKELVATCSSDRTVRLWSYTAGNSTFSSELCHKCDFEAHALAFHPSGLHLVVGHSNEVRMMNILDNKLVKYKSLPIKECREIVFANGGQYFACQNDKDIWVYKFYTASISANFKFVMHQQPVKRIAWLEDDTGFISCGQDAQINVWRLYPKQDEQNPAWSFKLHSKASYSSVASYKPEGQKEPIVYAACSDRSIREIGRGIDGEDKPMDRGKQLLRYEENLTYSQILVGAQRNMLYAGLAEPNRPGSIQVFRYRNDDVKSDKTMEKVLEVQAHAQQIERMRLNYDNTKLFSVGIDGTLACFSMQQKSSKLQQTDILHGEILIKKEDLDSIQKRIKNLKADIDLQEKTRDMQLKQTMEKNDEEIQGLEHEIEEQKMQFEQTTQQLTNEKEQVELKAEEEQEYLQKRHEEELRLKKFEYNEKMRNDAKRRQQLLKAKENQKMDFEKNIQELFLAQDKAKAQMHQEHQLQKQQKEQEYKQKQEEIEKLEDVNKTERKDIEEDAWNQIDKIKDDNREELNKLIKEGMDKKSDLQKETGKFRTATLDRTALQKEITEKSSQSRTLDVSINELKSQIEAQKAELESRRATIEDKDLRIIELKKKTQELEKFKFVLDYKIKELKRDILPRENNIASLHEQVNKMEVEVRHFQRISDNLDLIVNDLKMKHKGLEDENLNCGHKLDSQSFQQRRFKDDVFEVVQHIQDYKKLKKGVIRLYKAWVLEESNRKKKKANLEENDGDTGARGKHESHITYYRTQLSRSLQQHRENNARLMKDNVYLIKRINEMTKEKQELMKQISLMQQHKNQGDGNGFEEGFQNEQRKEIELMDMTIAKYQDELNQTQMENQELRMRRPPRNLAPLANDPRDQIEDDGQQYVDDGQYQDEEQPTQHAIEMDQLNEIPQPNEIEASLQDIDGQETAPQADEAPADAPQTEDTGNVEAPVAAAEAPAPEVAPQVDNAEPAAQNNDGEPRGLE